MYVFTLHMGYGRTQCLYYITENNFSIVAAPIFVKASSTSFKDHTYIFQKNISNGSNRNNNSILNTNIYSIHDFIYHFNKNTFTFIQ